MTSSRRRLGFSAAAIFGGCDVDILAQADDLCAMLRGACEAGGYTVVASVSHAFEPQGVTCALLLAQSHLVGHSWPEYGILSVDLFACAPRATLDIVLAAIRKASGARWVSEVHQAREMPDMGDELGVRGHPKAVDPAGRGM